MESRRKPEITETPLKIVKVSIEQMMEIMRKNPGKKLVPAKTMQNPAGVQVLISSG